MTGSMAGSFIRAVSRRQDQKNWKTRTEIARGVAEKESDQRFWKLQKGWRQQHRSRGRR